MNSTLLLEEVEKARLEKAELEGAKVPAEVIDFVQEKSLAATIHSELATPDKNKETQPALIIGQGGQRFAIPQANLLEVVRLDKEDETKTSLEWIQGAPVYRLRGHLLPVVSLNKVLQIDEDNAAPQEKLAVLEADHRQFGLLVDEIINTEEIPAKLSCHSLQTLQVYSGATILKDKKMALVIDIAGLANHAQVTIQEDDPSREKTATSSRAEEENVERQACLIVRTGDNRRLAIPLAKVARLEEFNLSSIEKSGTQDVVQYRDEIMPLIYLSNQDSVKDSSTEQKTAFPTVVCGRNEQSLGLVVEQILDIVEDCPVAKESPEGQNVLDTIVIQNQVTDVVDVDHLLGERVSTSNVKLLHAPSTER
jgi:two-component system, chemotaxis family, sensor kinase CheA